MTWDFAMMARALGDARAWPAIVFGLVKLGEAEAICMEWIMGG